MELHPLLQRQLKRLAVGREPQPLELPLQQGVQFHRGLQASEKTVTVMVWLCSSLTPPGTAGEISPYE